MSANNSFSRRQWLQGVGVGLVAIGLPGLGACKKELACSDTAGLSDAELAMRNAQAYQDKSPEADKLCVGCQLFVPASPTECGKCSLIKGPISPNGYCKAWVKKPA